MTDLNDPSDWGEEMAVSEHTETYSMFLGLLKWSSAIITIILLMLLIFVYF